MPKVSRKDVEVEDGWVRLQIMGKQWSLGRGKKSILTSGSCEFPCKDRSFWKASMSKFQPSRVWVLCPPRDLEAHLCLPLQCLRLHYSPFTNPAGESRESRLFALPQAEAWHTNPSAWGQCQLSSSPQIPLLLSQESSSVHSLSHLGGRFISAH